MILLTLLFILFTLWAIAYVGVPTSYSNLYYIPKTKYTYTMVMPMIGLTMIFTQQDLFLQAAGAALILGTAAPDYEHDSSFSVWLHFGFTVCAAFAAWWSVGGVWMAVSAIVMLGVAKLLSSQPAAKNAVFWAEVVLFAVVFFDLIFN